MKLKYFAAIDNDNAIITIGFVLDGRAFDRRCFGFTNQTFGRWVAEGSRYCQLNIDNLKGIRDSKHRFLVNQKIDIDTILHRKIKVSRAGKAFLKGEQR